MAFTLGCISYIQVRSNVKTGQGFGPTEEVTCGGNALRFYSAVRMRMMRKGLLNTGDKVSFVQLLTPI